MTNTSKRIFWDTSRRRYVSKALGNMALLFMGALLTSKYFEVSIKIKLILIVVPTVMIIIGTLVEPPDDKPKGGE